MSKIDNFISTMNFGYTPAFKTILVDTKRVPPKSGGKVGDPVTHLQDVASSPLILPSQQSQQKIRAAIGLDGTAVQLWELRMNKSTHTDGMATVTQLPDVKVGDRVVIDNVNYNVEWADITHPFSFGDVLLLYLTEDKRA